MFDFSNPAVFLSWLVFLPAVVALVIAFLPARGETIKRISLAHDGRRVRDVAGDDLRLERRAVSKPARPEMQNLFAFDWIPSFGIQYLMGIDGISFPLVVLTAFVSVLAMGASWPIKKHVKAYCVLFLLLETGMIGVFCALDFFLFYVFWEVMLLPMYFLIGIWGGPRKEYAAIKFFLYTLVGSVLMLIAILMLYFNSDLRRAAGSSSSWQPASSARSCDEAARQAAMASEIRDCRRRRDPHVQHPGHAADGPAHRAVQQARCWWGQSLQWWAFVLLFIGFAIKVPSVPLHTWLPDAHVEAPTPISMILAGVLLKMGGYGIIRICYPICPQAGYDLAYVRLRRRRRQHGLRRVRRDGPDRLQAAGRLQLGQPHGLRRAGPGRVERRGRQRLQPRLLEDGHERGHVPDDRPRHQLGRHVLPGRRASTTACITATSTSSAACSARCRSTAAWRSASSSPAWACRAVRLHRRSARRALACGTSAWRWR